MQWIHPNVGFACRPRRIESINYQTLTGDSFIALAILDPRQAQAFGPRTGPLTVGIAAGLILYATSDVASGYSGVNMNPARCFGIAIASGDWSSK
jgi:glycerol uptake facilitator-like aquaporin